MKDYRHMMGQVMLSDEKKEEIMGLLKEKRSRKGRMPAGSRLILVAALAAVCALCIAAGVPVRVFHLAAGGTETYNSTTNGLTQDTGGESREPVILEDGRLWLTIRDERTDVTDLIDGETPYIYDNTDPDTGYRDYLVVGGTPEDYGWVEMFEVIDGSFAATGGANTYTIYATIDGVVYTLEELTPEQNERVENYVRNNDMGVKVEPVVRPWLSAALEQLGIPE